MEVVYHTTLVHCNPLAARGAKEEFALHSPLGYNEPIALLGGSDPRHDWITDPLTALKFTETGSVSVEEES